MGRVKSKRYAENKTIDLCCRKEPYVRYTVVKFENETYGVLDKDRDHLICIENDNQSIDRAEPERVLKEGQTTLSKAKKIVKKLTKQIKDTTFTEIK